jgi:hypothetical protein
VKEENERLEKAKDDKNGEQTPAQTPLSTANQDTSTSAVGAETNPSPVDRSSGPAEGRRHEQPTDEKLTAEQEEKKRRTNAEVERVKSDIQDIVKRGNVVKEHVASIQTNPNFLPMLNGRDMAVFMQTFDSFAGSVRSSENPQTLLDALRQFQEAMRPLLGKARHNTEPSGPIETVKGRTVNAEILDKEVGPFGRMMNETERLMSDFSGLVARKRE